MPSIAQLQTHVLAPNEPVDYSNIVMASYPVAAIQHEPFIGFKLLCQDTSTNGLPPSIRLRQIDNALRPLINSGCILRESRDLSNNGIYVITMPVPRNQLTTQITRLCNVLGYLQQQVGILNTGLVEINVSGYCPIQQVETKMASIIIPRQYQEMMIPPENTPYRYGSIYRINEDFMCFRTKWNLSLAKGSTPNNVFDHLLLISQLICSMY